MLIIIFFAAYLQNKRNRFLSIKNLEDLQRKSDLSSKEELKQLCPICGFPFFKQFGIKPWDDDIPSNEICPGCGIQFGYDDYAGGDENKREEIHIVLRQKFFKKGKTYKNLLNREYQKRGH